MNVLTHLHRSGSAAVHGFGHGFQPQAAGNINLITMWWGILWLRIKDGNDHPSWKTKTIRTQDSGVGYILYMFIHVALVIYVYHVVGSQKESRNVNNKNSGQTHFSPWRVVMELIVESLIGMAGAPEMVALARVSTCFLDLRDAGWCWRMVGESTLKCRIIGELSIHFNRCWCWFICWF